MADQVVFLNPGESFHVITKAKDGYNVLEYTWWTNPERLLLVSTGWICENDACNLTAEGETLAEGYQKSLQEA